MNCNLKNMNRTTIVFSIIFCLLISLIPTQVHAINIWALFSEADQAQRSENHDIAIQKYHTILPEFIKSKDTINTALIYGRLANSYAHQSRFDEAAKNWREEAKLWGELGREQDQIIADRKANFVRSEVKLFVEKDSSFASDKYYTGAQYEPVLGAYIGAYAEMDAAVHNSSVGNQLYIDGFPQLTGKKHAGYLLYLPYGEQFTHYNSHYTRAKEAGVAIQLALQPMKGLDPVKDDAYLRQFAREAKELGIPIFLRFANEMNESSAPWYGDPAKYIEKFQLVANVFHQEAPNVVMVWAPNDFPPNTIEAYYPGDAYVDWVGISSYKTHRPELDPLGKGIDRESYVEKLETIHSLYGDRKPIFISEGAVSYTHITTGADVTTWASRQVEEFFTYLPMLYPSVKGYFWFGANDIRSETGVTRSFTLSKNEVVLKSYQEAVKNPYYLSNIDGKSPVFYADIQNYTLEPKKEIVHAYVKTAEPDIHKVVYKIGSETIGISTNMPWSIEYDFQKFAGQNVAITVEVYGINGQLITMKNIPVIIISENTITTPET